jgi:hypothetical protein
MIRTPIRKVSADKAKQNRDRAKAYAELDYDWGMVCQGCGRAGPVDHSHLLSQKYFPHLADHKANIVPHCRDCHIRWENPTQRWKLLDFQDNMWFIQRVAPQEFIRMLEQSEWKVDKHYPGELERFYEVRDSLI